MISPRVLTAQGRSAYTSSSKGSHPDIQLQWKFQPLAPSPTRLPCRVFDTLKLGRRSLLWRAKSKLNFFSCFLPLLQFVSVPGKSLLCPPTHLAPEKSQESCATLFKHHSSVQNQLWAPSALWGSIWLGGYFDPQDVEQPPPRSGTGRLERRLYLQEDNLETNAKPREQINKSLSLFTALSLPVSTGNCGRLFHVSLLGVSSLGHCRGDQGQATLPVNASERGTTLVETGDRHLLGSRAYLRVESNLHSLTLAGGGSS